MAVEISNFPDDDNGGPISSINVTPFVDISLVLLIIFMVTAPMIMKDVIGIRLPRAASGDGRKVTTLSVAITRNGNVLLNGKPAAQAEISVEVRRALSQNPDTQAVISADRDARHGDVIRVIDWIKTAGLSRFAIQIEREPNAPPH